MRRARKKEDKGKRSETQEGLRRKMEGERNLGGMEKEKAKGRTIAYA